MQQEEVNTFKCSNYKYQIHSFMIPDMCEPIIDLKGCRMLSLEL